MLTFAHSWLFLLLPLPLLLRWLLPPFHTARPAVRLPFFQQLAELTGRRPEAGAAIQRRSAVQGIGYVVIWCALIAALARPQWLEPPIVRAVPTRDLLLAVDLSGSMAPERFSLIGLVLTPDQQAQRQFRRGAFAEAAQRFTDPYWQAAAYYRAGDFKQAAGIYTGLDTPQAAFNHGNALVMLGQYEPAMARYDRALQLRPGWEAAQVNREIARQRAARVKQEGGEGTSGQLSADAIVFTQGKNPSQQEGEQDTSTGGAMSDAELRNRWLRRVQTAPADFLRAKFAYQAAMQDSKP